MTRKRRLRPEEEALWKQVAESTRPLKQQVTSRKLQPKQVFEPAAPEQARQESARVPRFAIGEAARKDRGGHDILPDLSHRVASAPVRMDRKTHQRMRRGRLDPEARLDLHGMTLDEAHPALISFILSSQAAGRRLVLVITGKGRRGEDDGPIPRRKGVLRHQLPHWLQSPPLAQAVLQVTEAHLRHGGGGAFYIYLRRGGR